MAEPAQRHVMTEGLWPGTPSDCRLPTTLVSVRVPPLKCQGIKTRLVKRIANSINWSGNGRWVEPFVGSAAVALNVRPRRALLSDSNVHTIRFLSDLASQAIGPRRVREHLRFEGDKLLYSGGAHYYEVRERFNRNPSSLDYLFLSRSCFNGLVRFNASGAFNVPFCRKPARFTVGQVTKIVNQVAYLQKVIEASEWRFEACDWQETVRSVRRDDFVYADPPYQGRFTDYFTKWDEGQENLLLQSLQSLNADFALSTWVENEYRSNPQIARLPRGTLLLTFNHHYHVGATQALRHAVTEGLVLSQGAVVADGRTVASPAAA